MTLQENLGTEQRSEITCIVLEMLVFVISLFQSFLRVCVSTSTAGLRSSWASLPSSPMCSSFTLTSLRSPRTCPFARLTSPTSRRSVCCHERWFIRKSRKGPTGNCIKGKKHLRPKINLGGGPRFLTAGP